MIRNTFKIVIITISLFIGFFTFSCKKGENDPLISLRSRKARLTGNWNLSSGKYTYNSPGIYNLKVDYDDGLAKEYTDGIWNKTFIYTVNFIINKDYTYERITNEDGFGIIEKGNWFFTKKSTQLGLKNREAIILSASSIKSSGVTTNYSGANADEILIIDRLKNDEIILKGERTYTSTVTDTETYEHKYLKN